MKSRCGPIQWCCPLYMSLFRRRLRRAVDHEPKWRALRRRGISMLVALLVFTAPVHAAGVLDATWTEPITNTDGSALTDLGSYKIYYLQTATALACPGTQFFTKPAPLATPGPNSMQSFGLTGLVAGQPYRVQVTAVDLTGHESACSNFAQATARDSPPRAITNTRLQ